MEGSVQAAVSKKVDEAVQVPHNTAAWSTYFTPLIVNDIMSFLHRFADFVEGSPHLMPNEVSVHVQEYGFGGSFFEDEFFDTDDDEEEEDQIKPVMTDDEWDGTVSQTFTNHYYLSERWTENSSPSDYGRGSVLNCIQGNIPDVVVRSVIKKWKYYCFKECALKPDVFFFREQRLLLTRLQIKKKKSLIPTSWRATHWTFTVWRFYLFS